MLGNAVLSGILEMRRKIMKICPNCNAQLDDNAAFCTNCGTQFMAQPQQNYNNAQAYQMPPQPNYAPQFDPYDHTTEFDSKDISENKVISMLVYLLGTIGIIIALLASNTSPYAAFHVRQALKFTVVTILSTIVTLLLCWTVIVPIVYGVLMLVLLVVKFICFFQICSGKAKEPVIIRSLKFLR